MSFIAASASAHSCSWRETTCKLHPGSPTAIAASKSRQAAPGIPGIHSRSSRTRTHTSASGGTSRRGWRGCASMFWCWTPTSCWRTTPISSSSRCTLSLKFQRTALLSIIVCKWPCKLSSGGLSLTTKLCCLYCALCTRQNCSKSREAANMIHFVHRSRWHQST